MGKAKLSLASDRVESILSQQTVDPAELDRVLGELGIIDVKKRSRWKLTAPPSVPELVSPAADATTTDAIVQGVIDRVRAALGKPPYPWGQLPYPGRRATQRATLS